jgi:hypothetical protein
MDAVSQRTAAGSVKSRSIVAVYILVICDGTGDSDASRKQMREKYECQPARGFGGCEAVILVHSVHEPISKLQGSRLNVELSRTV